jgi:hypothetical protein
MISTGGGGSCQAQSEGATDAGFANGLAGRSRHLSVSGIKLKLRIYSSGHLLSHPLQRREDGSGLDNVADIAQARSGRCRYGIRWRLAFCGIPAPLVSRSHMFDAPTTEQSDSTAGRLPPAVNQWARLVVPVQDSVLRFTAFHEVRFFWDFTSSISMGQESRHCTQIWTRPQTGRPMSHKLRSMDLV